MLNKDIIVGEDADPLLNSDNEDILTDVSINEDIEPGSSSRNLTLRGHTFNWFLFFNMCVSVLSTLGFGYNTGVISGVVLEIQTIFNLTTTTKSILVSSVLFGAMMGSLVSGSLCDRFGRKNTLLGNNFFYVLGPLLSALSQNYSTLVAGRVISGIGVGIASSAVPLYITEMTPPKIRGSYGLLRQSTVTFGIMLSSLVAYGMLKYNTGWRWTLAISMSPSLLQLVFAKWLVESPRWLISKDRSKEARAIMRKIEPSLTEKQITSQVASIALFVNEQSGDEGWLHIFQKRLTKVYIIGFGLNMLQQFVGINCVIYYSGIILEDAGFTKNNAVLIGALVGIPQLVVLLVSVWLIDRFGRKPLLLYGLVGMIAGLAVLGLPFYGDKGATGTIQNVAKGWMAVAGMVFFKLCFSLGLGPIPAILATEIYPSKVRSKAVAISQFLNWVANFTVNISFLHLFDKLGEAQTFWFFGGISLITFLFVIIIVPETKGLTIEDLSKKLLINK